MSRNDYQRGPKMENVNQGAEDSTHAGGLDHEALLAIARRQGAGDAAIIDASQISVEDELATMCLTPKCENYGLAPGCPPHVGGPEEFRRLIKETAKTLVYKIDLPSESLHSNDLREVMRLMHEIGAEVEQAAASMGAKQARAFAGGSCKTLFCSDQADCSVIDSGAQCRYPRSARSSMSGFGINVKKLMETAGWSLWKIEGEGADNQESMSALAGLVMLG